MKKLALMSILLLGSLAMALAEDQGITVGSPYLTSIWCSGGNYNIIWNFYGSGPNMKLDPGNQQVRIVLVGIERRPRVIADNAPNNGQFHWTIPGDVAPGNYHVRIVTLNKLYKGESGAFTIKSCPDMAAKGSRVMPGTLEKAALSIGRIAGRASASTQGNLIAGRKIRVLLKKGGATVNSAEYTLDAQGGADYQFTHLQTGTYEISVEKVSTPVPADALNVCFQGTAPAQRTAVIASGSTDISGQDFAIQYNVAFNMQGQCW